MKSVVKHKNYSVKLKISHIGNCLITSMSIQIMKTED